MDLPDDVIMKRAGFSLIELMVVIGIVVLLIALIFPAVHRMHGEAARIFCANNLRQLYKANLMYADDHGFFVAAASDINNAQLHRWHGVRENKHAPFDNTKSPLYPYLDKTVGLLRCPAFRNFERGEDKNAFEASCGGYGYNPVGVGSRVYVDGDRNAIEKGVAPEDLNHPASTIMFADCAMAQPYKHPKYLIEYSFADPYHSVSKGKEGSRRMYPCIHFRHNGKSNVVWCDGHVTAEKMSRSYNKDWARFHLGWFGPPDNTYYAP